LVIAALLFDYDGVPGVRAAKRAGLTCAAVPNQITRGASFDEADIVLWSLADRTVDEIRGALPEGRAY
jgi:beta-phosphoglucomutase-like phosphatase (HAD superfamily)